MRTMCALAALFLYGAASSSAQVIFGSIQGTVTDESGAVVPGARVTVKNVDTGLARSTTSNNAGLYFLGEVRPGTYNLETESTGFARFVQSGIPVRIEDRVRVDVRLRLGQITEQVEVTAEPPLVQSENTTLGKVVVEKTIKELPLSGRNAFALVKLVPGVSQRGGDEQPRLTGGRTRTGEFVLDGSSITEPRRGEVWTTPNLDAFQEFKVQTNGMSAEFGRTVGGIVNAALKSGSNRFQGNVYYFVRNDVLNARDYFAAGVPKLTQNQFGGIFGGPVIRDRTFFFMDYEGFRRRGDSIFNLTLPQTELKRGDFSSLPGANIGTDALGRPVAANQIFDPATTRRAPNGRDVREAFPGNIIPASRFDPAGRNVVALYAEPNRPGEAQNFSVLKPSGENNNKFDVRIDHRFSDADQVFGRFSQDLQDSLTARPYEYSSTGAKKGDYNRFRNGAINWTHGYSPVTLNDFRVAFYRGVFERILNLGSPEKLGIPNVRLTGLPRFAVPGYNQLGDTTVFHAPHEQYQAQNIATFVRGRHVVKSGGDLRRFRVNNLNIFRETFTMSPLQTGQPALARTGHGIASLLLGQVDKYENDPSGGREYQRTWYAGFFVQDDFKVSRSFTLNIGLRYDVEPNINEARYSGSNFDLFTGRPITMRDLNRNRISNTDKNNLAPRIGFAWRPFGLERTVIRSHYGIFYIPQTGRANASGAYNRFPLVQQVSLASDGVNAAVILSQTPRLNPTPDGAGLQQEWVDPNDPVGYFQQWNFDVQQELGARVLVQASYSASRGVHILGKNQWNEIRVDTVRAAGRSSQDMRPYPRYGDIISHDARGFSTYHSLQLSAEKRFHKGLSFLAAYTFSKAMDDSEDNFSDQFPVDSYNHGLEKSLSSAHYPHRLVSSAIWELPFGPWQAAARRRASVEGVRGLADRCDPDAPKRRPGVDPAAHQHGSHLQRPVPAEPRCQSGAARRPADPPPLVQHRRLPISGPLHHRQQPAPSWYRGAWTRVLRPGFAARHPPPGPGGQPPGVPRRMLQLPEPCQLQRAGRPVRHANLRPHHLGARRAGISVRTEALVLTRP